MAAKNFPDAPGVYGVVAVTVKGNYTLVQLHNTLVASLDRAHNIAVIQSSDYPTAVTRTAINRALTLWGFKGYVAIFKGVMYYYNEAGERLAPTRYPVAIRKDGSLASSDAVTYPELAV